MATRASRIAEFNSGEPPADQPFEILCEDHSGTYLVPFACLWTDGAWVESLNRQPIQAIVLGWRVRRTP